jgi:hypothetical protein
MLLDIIIGVSVDLPLLVAGCKKAESNLTQPDRIGEPSAGSSGNTYAGAR